MFLARQDLPAFEPAGADTRRVVDVWTKILSRGSEPPIHPAVERQLLLAEGFGEGDLTPAFEQGDLSLKVQKPFDVELFIPEATGHILDDLTESEAEREFVSWLAKSHSDLVTFLTPQVSFDMLLLSRGGEALGCRRADFLLSLPDGTLTVVEVDGGQHAGQMITDEERDLELSRVGIETIRITAAELKTGNGPNLDRVGSLVRHLGASGKQRVFNSLAWTPVLLHRFAFALGEALAAGFIAGPHWCISLNDPTFRLVNLVGPYLEMFWALDRLWGNSSLSPQSVTLLTSDCSATYHLSNNGRYLQGESRSDRPDVHIEIDVTGSPATELIPHPVLPTIILRTAPIGVRVSRPPSSGSSRIAALADIRETRLALTVLLQAIFAKAEFRPGQFEAVAELIAGRDCCVLLPTGAGKSLIYQLAGLCLPGRTLIIDPIVSLIEDQVRGLNSHGIDRAIGITSQSTRQGQTENLLKDIADADAYFMFVAPERLQMSNFRSALRELATTTPINLAVVDEAHCVSEWGHQFRTSYLGLGNVLRDIAADTVGNSPPLVALTGTASRAVLRDVLFQLAITEREANTIIRPTTFDRKELNYRIVRCEPDVAEASLRSVLKTLPGEFNESLPTFYGPDGEATYSGLIFVPTVNGTKNGLEGTRKIVGDVCSSVGMYSGGAPKGFRPDHWEVVKREYARAFNHNETTCLVSTNAFGMGIDKPNIRWVVHYGLSGSIESYYQEVGRAGRNGQKAQCVLILSEFDPARNSQLLAEDVSLEEARKRLEEFKWNERDDVTTALFFHANSFPGISDEVEALSSTVDQLSPSDSKKRIEIPFDDQDRQERALHRLIILGVVGDYLVEFGSKKFIVTLEGSDSDTVKRSLIAFVERTQPGRVEEMRNRMNNITAPHHETIVRSARNLIEFVYETVERSRRRSLREMLLAARHSNTDEELRNRVLEYLSEGDVGNILEELVDEAIVDLGRWTTEWGRIMSKTDAAEWRASSARLLASYPDHPGLLISRGLSELLDTDDGYITAAAIDEHVLNLESALQSATPHYNIPVEEVRSTMAWLVNRIGLSNTAAAAATASVAERYDVLADDDRARLKHRAIDDISAAIVHLDQTLIDLFHLVNTIDPGEAA